VATKFNEFIQEIEAEAKAEGPGAVARLRALRTRYQLARELLQIRKERQLTQARLAELSGVGQSEISKIESGSVNPTVGTMAALSGALDADLHLTAH